MRVIKIVYLLMIGFIFIAAHTTVHAAGPMMHVILGERWLANYAPDYTEKEKQLFLLGTVFPDIRYLGVIKRTQTHYVHPTLIQIKKEPSPFKQGMLFHSFVDEKRKNFVSQSGINAQLTNVPSRFRDTFLKLIEDQILNENHDWSEFRGFLTTIPEEEKRFNISEQALVQWHTGLTIYFTASPIFIIQQLSFLEKSILDIDEKTIQSWSVLLPHFTNNDIMRNYVKTQLNLFEKTLISGKMAKN